MIFCFTDGRQVADMFITTFEEWCKERKPEKITRIWFGENFSGYLTNVQIYSRLLSNQEMKDITTCRMFLPGDYISWQNMSWKTNHLGVNAPTEIRKTTRQRSIETVIKFPYISLSLLPLPDLFKCY